MTIINTRIKELRARYNLTQDELADKGRGDPADDVISGEREI